MKMNEMNRPPAVEMVGVTKVYGGGVPTPALNGVDLRIAAGESVAIVGPSGSGKSTMLNMMGALDRPTEGKVLIDGVEIGKLSDDELAKLRNEHIGFVFQSYNLIHRMRAIENVELPLIMQGLDPASRRKRALQVLETIGAADLAKKKPYQLSGGEQQRIAIARALVTDPSIILADEPTGNLDSKSSRVVMNALAEINRKKGKTLIVVTHNMEVAHLTRRIVYLRDGKVEREEMVA
jgi:putative ABC transport system ATP-binding protein